MPTKKASTKPESAKTKPEPAKEEAPKENGETVLVAAAKAIGKAAGKVAALVSPAVPTPKRPRIGKLVKKNKSRLPRRQKKAQQKATAKRV
jgi:hypothetical protein